jgi:hypothetical protein
MYSVSQQSGNREPGIWRNDILRMIQTKKPHRLTREGLAIL